MLGRRLLILVVVLMGLTALAASVAPRDGSFTRPVTSEQPGPSPTAPATGSGDVEAEAGPVKGSPAVEEATNVPGEPSTTHLDVAGERRTIDARVGERIRLEIAAGELATVQVGDDGLMSAIDPDAPARFDLLYDEPGREEIRVLSEDPRRARTIAVLRVR